MHPLAFKAVNDKNLRQIISSVVLIVFIFYFDMLFVPESQVEILSHLTLVWWVLFLLIVVNGILTEMIYQNIKLPYPRITTRNSTDER